MLIFEILDIKDWKQSKHIGISGYTTSRNTFGVFDVYLKRGSASGVVCNSQEHFLRSSLCCLLQSNSLSPECVRVKILSASDQRVVCILAATIAATEQCPSILKLFESALRFLTGTMIITFLFMDNRIKFNFQWNFQVEK